jgi:DHA1 family bicyclomycin/chloramphenicol resistance-like MFS transporter
MIGALWGWMSTLPLLFVGYLGVSVEHYGYYGLAGILAYVLGTLVNSKLVGRYSLRTLLTLGLWLALISSILLVIVGFLHKETPFLVQTLFSPFAFGLAFIIPNGTALAFFEVKEGMGTSSALLGSLEMAAGAFGVFLVGQLFSGTIVSIAGVMAIATLACLVLHRKIIAVD